MNNVKLGGLALQRMKEGIRRSIINQFHTCDNLQFGFNCMCEWEKQNPGKNEYCCEFCGIYTASKARCNKCELYKQPIEVTGWEAEMLAKYGICNRCGVMRVVCKDLHAPSDYKYVECPKCLTRGPSDTNIHVALQQDSRV